MIVKIVFVLALCILLLQIAKVNSHGLLLIPPARSSAWREDPARFPSYYGDNQMFCGGVNTQYSQNNGKCGICGEDYAAPKKFEKGGEYYRGYIVRTYSANQNIDAVVEITANHKGFFEFRLCNVDDIPEGEATQECLDKTILSDKNGRTKIPVTGASPSKFLESLVIPEGFQCKHCVLQWAYTAGNSWGTDPLTGNGCMGCGNQEQFYGCSDIRIVGSAKRAWSIDAPPPEAKVAVKKSEEYQEEQTMVSKSLLKRLFEEFKRMKAAEKETMANNQEKKQMVNERNEVFEQRGVNDLNEFEEMNAREYVPQDLQYLELNHPPKVYERVL